MLSETEIREKLKSAGLKVTPQRFFIYKALVEIRSHPTADELMKFVKSGHPNIATGTFYKVLESLVNSGLVEKVFTDGSTMRFEATIGKHHHLMSPETGEIADYYDEELNEVIRKYFDTHKIEGFDIQDFNLQLKGTFNHKKI